jgi:hypothetical protein
MAEARPSNSSSGATRSQRNSAREGIRGDYRKAHRPKTTTRLLNLKEATALFGVDYQLIYRLAELDLIECMQVDGKGRVYYSERQIRRALVDYCYLLLPAAA